VTRRALRPVRVGVVGAGALGFHHIRLLKKIAGADLVGFHDHNAARSAQVSKELETTAFPSLAALLDRVEAVTVVVPTRAHVEVGMAVLERGLHALIEKPLADTLAGAEQLVNTARERGLCLQVGHVERFNRAVRAATAYL
jgi:predicted dehydrogenase